MPNSFLDEVQREFAFLYTEPGCRILESEDNPSSGYAAVYLGSDLCRVRILRERRQVFADLALPSGPPEWFDAPLILQYLGQEEAAAAWLRTGQHSTSALAQLLREFYPEIVLMFSPGQQAQTVRDLKAPRGANTESRWR